MAKYRAENLEKFKAWDAKYRAENTEKIKAWHAKYRAENPEKFKAWRAKHRAENPEKFRARQAKYRAENLEKCKALKRSYIDEIKDNYVADLLKIPMKVLKDYPDLIEAKRELIKSNRTLKQIKEQTNAPESK